MTAPVVTSVADGRPFMAFVIPERFDLEGTPPRDERVKIELVEGRRLAAVRFSGYATEECQRMNLAILEEALRNRGIEARGLAGPHAVQRPLGRPPSSAETRWRWRGMSLFRERGYQGWKFEMRERGPLSGPLRPSPQVLH